MQSIGAVIVAAGYGSVRSVDGSPFPKVVEAVGGRPMIVQVVNVVMEAGLHPVVVVVNPMTADSIHETLRQYGYQGFHEAIQPDRFGSADAVLRAVPILRQLNCRHFLVIYADMPLWAPGTIGSLVRVHLEREATISMVSVPLDGREPLELRRYGRILYDAMGAISRVVEVHEATEQELRVSTSVNPSLWAWDLEWLAT